METISIIIDLTTGESVTVPVPVWERALTLHKSERAAFLARQAERAPEPWAAPARSLARPVVR